MDTGQISFMPANVGTPTSGGAQSSSLTTLPSEPEGQADGPFAGLLEGMTPPKTPQGALAPVSVGKGVPTSDKNGETAPTTAVQDGMSGLVAGLLNALDATGKPLATGSEQSAEAPTTATANKSDNKPQNVVLNADGLWMALLTQVNGGRMPQAGGAVEQQAVNGADETLASAMEVSAEVAAPADTLKLQDAMNADGMQPLPLPQADGTVMQQAVAALMADTSGTSLSNNRGVLGLVASTSADAGGLGSLKGASTDPTALEVVPKGNEPQDASQKELGRTTLPALTSQQVSAIVEQQNQAVVNSAASTERGTAPSNQNGNVSSTVAPASGTPGTTTASGVEVTAQPQQDLTLFRSASLEVALAESVPQNEVSTAGQTQIGSPAQNMPVAEIPAASTDNTTQTALQQDISPAISGATPVPATLSPASSQQPGQEATTNNNSTLEAAWSVQAAVVPAAEKMGTEAVSPERGKTSNDGQGNVSGASAPQNEARTAGQAQIGSSAQGMPAVEIPAASTSKTVQTEPQQVVKPAESGVMSVQVAPSPGSSQESDQAASAIYEALEGTGSAQAAVVSAAGKTGVVVGGEAVQTQPESAAAAMPVQSSAVEAVKFAGTGSSGGEFSPGDDKGTADNFMNGQFHATMMHQQGNVDGASVADNVSAPVQNDVQQSGLSEQILQQVRDRLVNHDIKAGNDQIVLRLSPENLGDIKVNLSMDGQRLKVEIVADNHMVRDALLQNTGSLKESLARQNISMESFDVTTGGRGAGNSGQGQQQSDWREFAQQKQQNAWMSSGGYRLPEVTAVPAQSAYQTPSQHAMVDLHF